MIVSNDLEKWAGKFGNRVFALNNLVQISHYFGHDYYCKKFNGSEIFKIHDNLKDFSDEKPHIDEELSVNLLLSKPKEKIELDKHKTFSLDWTIHEFFFEYDDLSTFEIFDYKDEFINDGISFLNHNSPETKKRVGIHFRGNDFSLWDKKSILPITYYTQSIDEVESMYGKESHFTLYTDDFLLESFVHTIEYLNSKNIEFSINKDRQWKVDLLAMAYSDVLISSPSTFCIVAGFTGKKGKQIIHSKEWVDNYRVKTDYFRDIFWKILLNEKGNKNYMLYKTI